MRSLHLIGGGWDPAAATTLYGPFLEACGPRPTIACVVLDEGDGDTQFARWATVLRQVSACEPVPVLVPVGAGLDSLDVGDGVLVCGGLTPAYAAALNLLAVGWLGDRPYCGFSAGAAVAAVRAVVGGWRDGEVEVCPEDASEDLDQVTVVDGLGLVDLTIDVHCAQWGTLPRLIAALGPSGSGVGLDENTALHVRGDEAEVTGSGSVHHVVVAGGVATVRTARAGDMVPV